MQPIERTPANGGDRATAPERETHDLPEAGARLGIGRTLSFDLARRGEFPVPVIRLGRRLVVSKAAVDRLLGGDAA